MKNECIIEMLGGKEYVASQLGISTTAVYMWFYEKPKGAGGIIPLKRAVVIHKMAQEAGIDCTITDVMGL